MATPYSKMLPRKRAIGLDRAPTYSPPGTNSRMENPAGYQPPAPPMRQMGPLPSRMPDRSPAIIGGGQGRMPDLPTAARSGPMGPRPSGEISPPGGGLGRQQVASAGMPQPAQREIYFPGGTPERPTTGILGPPRGPRPSGEIYFPGGVPERPTTGVIASQPSPSQWQTGGAGSVSSVFDPGAGAQGYLPSSVWRGVARAGLAADLADIGRQRLEEPASLETEPEFSYQGTIDRSVSPASGGVGTTVHGMTPDYSGQTAEEERTDEQQAASGLQAAGYYVYPDGRVARRSQFFFEEVRDILRQEGIENPNTCVG